MPDSITFSPRLRRCLIVAAALWILACLLAVAQATAAARLLRWSVPQLELAAIDGSFWQGSAGQAFINLGNQRIALGRLDWALNGWSLLWLHPSAKISAEWGEQIIAARVRVNRALRKRFGGAAGIVLLDEHILSADTSADYLDTLHFRPEAYPKLEAATLKALEAL